MLVSAYDFAVSERLRAMRLESRILDSEQLFRFLEARSQTRARCLIREKLRDVSTAWLRDGEG